MDDARSTMANRPEAALGRLVSGASVRGEHAVSVARLVLGTLGLAHVAIFDPPQSAGMGRFVCLLAALAIALLWSTCSLARLRRGPHLVRLLLLSVSVDALVLVLVGMDKAVWPTADYAGFLASPEPGLFLLAVVGSGLRLSRRVALTGTALLVMGQAFILTLDHRLPAGHLDYGPPEMALWAVILVGAGALSWSMATRARELMIRGADTALQAERARQRLGVYVSEEVAAEALAADVLEMGGRRQEAAILFSDLRGFTRYAEKLPPERLVAELNEYLDAMVRVVREQGGLVDKFIGDAVMVVFGIPSPRPDDAARAIRTGAAMEQALQDLNRRRSERGSPPLRHGIGIHFGSVVAGNIGNADRLQFTVVGDAVNLASRLESATKDLAGPMAVSAEAVAAARASGAPFPEVTSLGAIHVRGREEGLEVYGLAESSALDGGRLSA